MKIGIISDLHGKDIWRKIVENKEVDKWIMMGDYFDSFNISGEMQISNFRNIIEYKKENMDNTILLIGNHDYHYLDDYEQYSGYQPRYAFLIKGLLGQYKDLFQMCYIQNNYLFIHAGITKTWLKSVSYTGEESLDIFVNDVYHFTPNKFRFTSGIHYNNYGDEICQTPIWVRPASLVKDKIDNYIQVIGHTQQLSIIQDIKNNIILTDCLDTINQYIIIEDDKVLVKKL